MIGHGEKITRKREIAISALLAAPNLAAAANEAGIGVATLRRWLKDPQFHDAYKDARQRVVDQTVLDLQLASIDAVATLREIATDHTAPHQARVAAARSILSASFDGMQLLVLDQRVRELESAVDVEAN